MIEARGNPKNITIGNVKDGALLLLDDEIQSKNDEQNEKNKVDMKY